MAQTKMAITTVDGLPELYRAFKRLDAAQNAELREITQSITEKHADALRNAAAGHPDRRVQGQAPGIKAKKDRVPTITLGGAGKIPVRRLGLPPTRGDVLFGTEFGADPGGENGFRFPPSSNSIWLYRTLKTRQMSLVSEWQNALDMLATKWSEM
jgi:hypothetical protein